MNNVAVLRSELPEPGRRDYLGPASVVEAGTDRVLVRLPSGRVTPARLALAFLYEPALDDVVLVIGDAEGCYVIGVLAGTGRAKLTVPGDLELASEGGKVRLSAAKGVEITAPEVELRAGKLRVVADAVKERFGSLCQRVVDSLAVHAGRTHTVVEGSAYSQAKSATMLTADKMTLNGKQIHLG